MQIARRHPSPPWPACRAAACMVLRARTGSGATPTRTAFWQAIRGDCLSPAFFLKGHCFQGVSYRLSEANAKTAPWQVSLAFQDVTATAILPKPPAEKYLVGRLAPVKLRTVVLNRAQAASQSSSTTERLNRIRAVAMLQQLWPEVLQVL